MKKTTQRHDGQAILEYMLLSAIAMLIFGAVFLMVRKQVYFLWVCDLMPRIQSPAGCNPATSCRSQVYGRTYRAQNGAQFSLDQNVKNLKRSYISPPGDDGDSYS
jgi:hypothetical protein